MAKYIWYSGATDITGKALAEALNLTGTKTKPRDLRRNDIIIGWGAKTREDIDLPCKVLNHPNNIRNNRNKFKALQLMVNYDELNNNIATFCIADDVLTALRNAQIKLPLVGRKNFHQGGKEFWLCLNEHHVESAIEDGAQYFQEYINIVDEYRIHVAFGNVIYAVRKIESPSEEHWIEQRKEKIYDYAEKNNVNLDDDTVNYVLNRIVKEVTLPDRIVRSNRRGWKFSSVRIDRVSLSLKQVAIKAVEALNLDFGAVDCAIDENERPYIIEVNSGPGLQGTTLEKYIAAFRAKLEELENGNINNENQVVAVNGNVNEEIADNDDIDVDGLVRIMRNVRNDAEARAVIRLIMGHGQ